MYFEKLIRPAILRLLSEEEGGYRVERDLHHHLTICLQQIRPLQLGRQDRVIRYEEPTKGKYSWRGHGSGFKAGNVDFFFTERGSGLRDLGTAMEVNFNYDSSVKIEQDFIKLLDPRNAYKEMVYFAYGLNDRFREAVVDGLERAFQWFREDNPDFLLPIGLNILVVENQRSLRKRLLWETRLQEPCLPTQLAWDRVTLPTANGVREDRHLQARERVKMSEEIAGLYITRAEAEAILHRHMGEAGIPLKSKTARCMFDPTTDSRGNHNCKFGRTPLWDNELRAIQGKVLRSEFMDWVDRLVESGRKFQKAGRASWK